MEGGRWNECAGSQEYDVLYEYIYIYSLDLEICIYIVNIIHLLYNVN